MHTLIEFLDYTASRFGTLEAYTWAEGERIVSKTYTEWREDAARMAAYIRDRFGTRQKIALIGDMSYPWICAYYGIMNSGNISVPLDTKLNPDELSERLNFADVSIVFLSEKYAAMKSILMDQCELVTEVLPLEDCPTISAGLPVTKPGPVDPDALASLMFTSGTSGDGLKAAMITHRAILADVTGPVPLCVPGDRLLSLLPIHHCFEIFAGQMKYLYLGATICVNDSMANLIPNLTRFRITIVVAVPALANMLAALIARSLKEHSIDEVRKMLGGRLRRITIGGASASKEVIETLAMAGITVFVGYGLTETAGGCLANCDASIRPREAGAPYVEGMEMMLDDGELCLRGPMIMQGYYKAEDLTRKVIRDGWLHTGDLAEITEENYVIIHGRKDNMIKTPDGEKIYPEVWESRLTNIPGVAAAMVADINHHLTAIISLKENSQELRNTVTVKIDDINTGLPNYEKISDVRFREKPFPMTTSLKIRRAEVMKEMSRVEQVKSYIPPQNDDQRRILEKILEVLPADTTVGIEDNLYDLGLDSLSTICLSLLLDCPPETIYACKTVRRLSDLLSGGIAGARTAEQFMKAKDINRYISIGKENPTALGKTVLLTGASGYLGIHLLDELTRAGKNLICLVRSMDSLKKASDYYGISCDKAKIVIGDITKERFGLTEEAYSVLCDQTDAVFHAAALVNHVGNLDASVRVNVDGTREVVRFCEKSGAALIHISSYAVTGFGTDTPLTEDVLDIGQEISQNPYIRTKYQAEELVLQARAQGVLSTIFRVGNLTARAFDGLFQMNADASGMAAQLNAFRKMGVYPESMCGVPYDKTAVDKAAEAIILFAESRGTGHIWHIMNPDVKYLDQLTSAKAISDAEFAAKLAEAGADRDTAIMSVYYRMRLAGFNTRFDSNKTQNELTKLNFYWQ